MLEWYDFTIYAFVATYLAEQFFPGTDPNASLLKAYLAFGGGFIVRPLGALVIGSYGDRAGRRAALTLTILLMALGTAIIAGAPVYTSIGLWAPFMLLAGRLLQGLSAGGEVGSAVAYLVETAHPARRGLVSSVLQASMGLANICGIAVVILCTGLLNHDQMQAYGWRIPFILGLIIVPVGLYLRRTLVETDEFTRNVKARAVATDSPIRNVWRRYPRQLTVGLGLGTLWASSVYVFNVYMPTYVQRNFGFSAPEAYTAALVANCLFVGTCLLAGTLADRLGCRRLLIISSLLLLVIPSPALMWLTSNISVAHLVLVQSMLAMCVALFVGAAPMALGLLFPAEVRSTGSACVYNFAFTIFGGFAPAILTWLAGHTSYSKLAPAGYVMGMAVVALGAALFGFRWCGVADSVDEL